MNPDQKTFCHQQFYKSIKIFMQHRYGDGNWKCNPSGENYKCTAKMKCPSGNIKKECPNFKLRSLEKDIKTDFFHSRNYTVLQKIFQEEKQ
jgi:hypothetical protein